MSVIAQLARCGTRARMIAGAWLRGVRMISEAGEDSLLNLAVKVTMPCLIFESVATNPALRAPDGRFNLNGGEVRGEFFAYRYSLERWRAQRAVPGLCGHGRASHRG